MDSGVGLLTLDFYPIPQECLSLLYREEYPRPHFASEILFWNLTLPNAGFLICCGASLLQGPCLLPKGLMQWGGSGS